MVIVKEIQLTKGKIAIVDDEDFEWLNKRKWHTQEQGNTFYARRSFVENGQGKTIRMHREIMKAEEGDIVDHIDGNGLNNKKSNLRLVTKNQNSMNCRSHKNSSSRFKGVHWHKNQKRWHAKIQKDGKKFFIGSFDDEVQAAKSYDKKAKELFGEYAKVNFTKKGETNEF